MHISVFLEQFVRTKMRVKEETKIESQRDIFQILFQIVCCGLIAECLQVYFRLLAVYLQVICSWVSISQLFQYFYAVSTQFPQQTTDRGTDRRTDRRTDLQTDRRTDRRTERRTSMSRFVCRSLCMYVRCSVSDYQNEENRGNLCVN